MNRKSLKETILAILIASVIVCVIVLAASWIKAGNQTTSSTFASAIVDQARVLLGDPTTYGGTQKSIWSDTALLQYLNDGTMKIVADSHCLVDIETEVLIASQTHYTLADPFIVIKYVLYNDEYGLKPGTIEKIGRTGSSDEGEGTGEAVEPTHWTHQGNSVIVYPAPDSTASGNEVDVYVVDRPVAVASAETVLVPAQYDRALVYYITAHGWAQEHPPRMDLFRAFMGMYQGEIDRYREDFNVQPGEKVGAAE